MTTPGEDDDLVRLYHQASAHDERRPADRVHEAVRAHALMLLAANQRNAGSGATGGTAANQPRWKISMFASVLLAGLAGLLVLQFDQGTPQEKDLVHGVPVPSAATGPSAMRAPLPESAPDKARGAGAGPAPVAPAAPLAKPAPATQARVRATESPTAAKRAAPEPFAAPPADAQAQVAPPDVDTPSQASGRVSAKSAPAPETAGLATPAPATTQASPPARAEPAAPSPMPSTQAQARSSPAHRSAALADKLVRKDSETAPAQSARLGALARSVPSPTSALHEAARWGRLAELERQIAAGTPIDAADAAGRTPLMLAAINGHADVVQRLLAAGANRTLLDHAGLTALQHARRLGLERIAAMIEAGA